MSLARQALLGERLSLPDESDLGREAHRDREGVGAVLEVRLAGGQRTGEVAGAPGVHDRPGRGLLGGRGEQLDLAPPDLLAGRPGGELLDLGREGGGVVADDLDERARGLAVRLDADPLELRAHPAREVARLRHLEREHLPRLGAERGQRRALQLAGDEREHRALDRARQVAGDRLLVLLLPALDVLDDDEAPAVVGEEAECVQRRDGLVPGGGLRGVGVDRLGAEAGTEALERTPDLRTVAAGQEVDRAELALGHRAQA